MKNGNSVIFLFLYALNYLSVILFVYVYVCKCIWCGQRKKWGEKNPSTTCLIIEELNNTNLSITIHQLARFCYYIFILFVDVCLIVRRNIENSFLTEPNLFTKLFGDIFLRSN